MELGEETITNDLKYKGRIISVRDDCVRLPNGNLAFREVVKHPGGVAIVPLLNNGSVIMVRQYRYAVKQEILEIPAGKLDPGEEPLAAASRELKEETGYTADRLQSMGIIYPSVGFLDETLHLYLATGLKNGESSLDEDEFLNVEEIELSKLVGMIESCEISDAKTIIGILKTKLAFGL